MYFFKNYNQGWSWLTDFRAQLLRFHPGRLTDVTKFVEIRIFELILNLVLKNNNFQWSQIYYIIRK